MAAASRSTQYHPLGLSAGPEATVLVESTNIDVDSTIDFSIVGPCEVVEVTIISSTAKTSTPSVVFTLQAYDLASNSYEDLIAASALTDAGSKTLIVGRNIAAVANVAAQRLPREKMRLKIDYTGTPSTDVLNAVTVTARAN